MSDERKERCETCRFWESTESSCHEVYGPSSPDDNIVGYCRRFPPTHHHEGTTSSFPATVAEDWCGEWQAKGT